MENINLQLKSMAIYSFLKAYMTLERNVKALFNVGLGKVSESKKNILYFYYGGLIGSTIEHDSDTLELKKHSFKQEESFGDLSMIQILKINHKHEIVQYFPKSIKSLKNSLVELDFFSTILKLISMRNVLAHEIENMHFKEQKDVVEVLPLKQEDFPFLGNFDIQDIEQEIQFILSNCIYAKKINVLLVKEISNMPSNSLS